MHGSGRHTTSWDDLYEVASAQEGHLTTAQAAAAGYSPQLLAKHLRSGRITRVRHAVYRIVHFPAGEHENLVVLWLWSNRTGVFSLETALVLHELSDALPARVHMTLPRSGGGSVCPMGSEHRLREMAAGDGGEHARLRQLLVFDRFLARVVTAFGDRVTLKGGLAVELRLENARTTKDVDLRLVAKPDDVLPQLQEAGGLDLGEFLRFEVQPDPRHPELEAEGMRYQGFRYRTRTLLAGKIYGSLMLLPPSRLVSPPLLTRTARKNSGDVLLLIIRACTTRICQLLDPDCQLRDRRVRLPAVPALTNHRLR